MGRAPCCDKDGLKKGPWLPEEDQKLLDYIQKHGPGNWRTLPKKAGLERCGKSCRLRWTNYLRPDIKRGRFSFEEEEAIIQLHSVLGNKWSAIAAKLPGRTDNEIKNYWNTHIRKRLLRMGIDPVTHTRRLDFLDIPSMLNNTSASLLQSSSDHQLNLLKLLSLQSLVNPNLLNLASLISTTQAQNQNFLLQNSLLPNDNNNNQIMQNQFINNNNPVHNTYAPANNTAAFAENQMIKSDYDQLQQQQQQQTFVSSNTTTDAQNYAPQTSTTLANDQWQNNNTSMFGSEIAEIRQNSDNYQAIMDSLLDTLGLNTSTANNNNNNNNNNSSLQDLRMPPLLSTPPLSASNSAYQPNSSSTTTTTSSEDEIDSYCENLMNFDVPLDLFVNNL